MLRSRLGDACAILLAPVWLTGAALFLLGLLPTMLLWPGEPPPDDRWFNATT